MKAKLLPRIVESAKPEDAPYEIHDTDLRGLLLRVQPSGVKSYVVTWGRGKRRTLGRHPVMTVTGARHAALAALSESAKHGAPLAVIEAKKPAQAKPMTLGDYIEHHYTPWAKANQKAGSATIAAIDSVFRDLYERELRSVSAFDIERVKSQRLKANIKPSTVNRDLSRIRGAFSRAVDWGLIAENPLKTVKQVKGGDDSRVRYLSKDEDRRLRKALAAREQERRKRRASGNEWSEERSAKTRPEWPVDGFTDHLMPIFLLAINTGLRRGELLGLAWSHVNLPNKLLTVSVGNSKSRKARHVPLNAEALDAITRWKKQSRESGLVFPSPAGVRMESISSSWEAVCDAAKLKDFRFHDLRHSFASRLVMAGVDLNTVRELLGHSDIRMTLRYAHLAPSKLAEAVALI
jgi:integrase